ncbi:glycoside hydrolase family 130 protein [Actinokineospora sp. NBRC 105648]|uniref:glycoside hydrolase family 130 protein n=1 Tax=Actinokineospora sp. NBRC 105648 TaxID=3032206 RepID=UPI0024A59570|nr:glycoside hydrolase family 130 protein [Actinokineospora sp. NBRC 105648]GLZ36956.1 glycosidase [Actinokineospora sp. NBRC 105648]
MGILVTRTPLRLPPDPRRVITKLFVPGEERPEHESRSAAVIRRVMALDEPTVLEALNRTTRLFERRHRDIRATFADHFAGVSHRLAATEELSEERRLLIGAYFTHEYSVEGAALCNPSMVAHPDQTGVLPGGLRFVLSVRGIGEGHLSSVGFRTGTIAPGGTITLDQPADFRTTGTHQDATLRKHLVLRKLAELGQDDETSAALNRYLPDNFTGAELDLLLGTLHPRLAARQEAPRTAELIRWIAACHYAVQFPEDTDLSERVLWPASPAERHGIEDARFVRLTDDDGTRTYYATYTAYDGSQVAPQLIQTDDFRTFHISQLTGSAAANKGMALFPRKINGRFAALSRGDGESTAVGTSTDVRSWTESTPVHVPARDWELVQVGNCGPPIETPNGWLVLTHGVGPMRVYSIGAILLDLVHPERVVATLPEPLLLPAATERDGYVPNVVYSCGSLLYGNTLVIPYGTSDSSIALATVSLRDLLAAMVQTDS